MKGSTSRRICASRIARRSRAGMTSPLTTTVATAMTTGRTSWTPWRSSARAPRRAPWRAAVLMTVNSLLVPRTMKFSRRTATKTASMTFDMRSPGEQCNPETREEAGAHEEARDLREPEPGHDGLDHSDEDGDGDHAA